MRELRPRRLAFFALLDFFRPTMPHHLVLSLLLVVSSCGRPLPVSGTLDGSAGTWMDWQRLHSSDWESPCCGLLQNLTACKRSAVGREDSDAVWGAQVHRV